MSSHASALESPVERTWNPSRKGFSNLTKKLSAQPRWILMLAMLGFTAFLGWLDYITGWEVSFAVVYAIPILLTVWLVGLNAAIFMAVLCGPIWWLANAHGNPYQTQWGYTWAMVSGIIYRIFVAIAGGAIRLRQQADEEQIRMLNEMRQLEKQIITATEREQQRIGQDLHDGLCQQLAAIGCATRALADDLRARAVPEAGDAAKIEEAIQQTVIEARSLARGIFPVHVDRSGLSAALADLAGRTSRLTGLAIQVAETVEVEIDDPEVAMHLYRIAQEAVANAVRHSGARKITLFLEVTDDQLELRIDDDGAGISHRTRDEEGMGLRTMQYRAQSIGAQFSVQPREGGGTSVSCRLRIKTQFT